MAEAALFIGWGEATRGREKEALEIFNKSVQYWGRLQQEGKIERFDVALLSRTVQTSAALPCCAARRSRLTRFNMRRSGIGLSLPSG